MKKVTRIMAMMMISVLVIVFTGCGEDSVTARVSVSMAGEVKIFDVDATVTDVNENGVIDMDDALKTVAKESGEEYASADGGYGLGITNLMGDDSGAFGYYLNNEMAANLETEISEGAYIDVFSYMDTEGFSDSYAYFTERDVTSENGEATLTLMKVTFDNEFNPVSKPCAGARVTEEDNLIGKTDKDGKITVKTDGDPHTFVAEGDGLVPACVNVR